MSKFMILFPKKGSVFIMDIAIKLIFPTGGITDGYRYDGTLVKKVI